MQDLRYAFRQLRQSPGFTIAAVLSLALGIGANTAIFQLVDAIRLKSLPVRDAQELATIAFPKGSTRSGIFSTRSARFTSVQYDQIRAQQQGFREIFAWSATDFNLAPGGEARHAEGLYVSGNFFSALGVEPMIGRTFSADDDSASCATPGAVISSVFWQRELGGAANVLTRTVSLDGHTVPVIGVTGPQFFGAEVGRQYDVAVPLCVDRLFSEDGKGRAAVRNHWWLSLMGRLKPGWTPERASAQLRAVAPAIMQATLPPAYKPDSAKKYLQNKLEAVDGASGVSFLRNQFNTALSMLMATTGLVLLIACANLANLLLARASVREREIAVRLAIGASRARLVRQLLMESVLLAVCGAALGAVLATGLSQAMLSIIKTSDSNLYLGLGIDWRTLGFTGGLAMLTCLLFGLAPAMRATHLSPASAIRTMSRSVTASRQRVTLRRLLVCTQVALSLVLLTGSILFVRSLRNLMTTDAGFNPEGVVTVQVNFTRANYPKERRIPVQQELRDRLAAIPGVVGAGQTGFTPISGAGWNNTVGPDDTPAATSGKNAYFNYAGPGYFGTMETKLIAGREFDERDRKGSPKVAIVNETFARKYFGGKNPVGHTFREEASAGKPEPLFQIVGMVKDTKYYDINEEFLPIAWLAPAQDEQPDADATFVVRVRGNSAQFVNSAKSAIAGMSPVIGLHFGSMSAQVRDSLTRDRLMAALSGGFAGLAALLATLGLYSVIAYMVVRRRGEIGVRIALGAERGQVVRLVLREAVILLGVGLVVGVGLSLAAGRTATSLLYGLKPHDPVSIAAAVGLLSVITLAAAYAPARRAAGLEPMIALRDDG